MVSAQSNLAFYVVTRHGPRCLCEETFRTYLVLQTRGVMSKGGHHQRAQRHKQRSEQEPRRAEVEVEQHEQHVHRGHAHVTRLAEDGRDESEERGQGTEGEGTTQPPHVHRHSHHSHSPGGWTHGR